MKIKCTPGENYDCKYGIKTNQAFNVHITTVTNWSISNSKRGEN